MGPDGEQIELRVSGDHRVMVLGYEDEPYLRIDQRGVFENRGSPAVRLNRSRTPSGPVPDGVGPTRWVRVSTEPVARWHDHRAHWMGGTTPEIIRENPDRSHVIDRFRIPIRVDGTPAAIGGQVRWDPPPPTVLWYAIAALIAVAVLVASRRRPRTTLAGTAMILAIGEAVHLAGSWAASSGSTMGRLGAGLVSVAAILILGATGWFVARHEVGPAAPGLVIAGLFAVVAGGLGELSSLSHSTIPTSLPANLARFLVVLALGGGVALGIAGATRLRLPEAAAPPPLGAESPS